MIVTLDSSELENGASDLVSLLEWSSRSQRPARSLLAGKHMEQTMINMIINAELCSCWFSTRSMQLQMAQQYLYKTESSFEKSLPKQD